MDTSEPGFLTRMQTWGAAPITTPMDFLSVVLTVVLISTVAFAWIMVMRHVTEE